MNTVPPSKYMFGGVVYGARPCGDKHYSAEKLERFVGHFESTAKVKVLSPAKFLLYSASPLAVRARASGSAHGVIVTLLV